MIVEEYIHKSGKAIFDIISNKNNFLIGRLQGIEAGTIKEYVENGFISNYLKNCMQQNTGFYCLDDNFDDILKKWCEIYLDSLLKCDLLYRNEFPTWDVIVKEHYEKIYVFTPASFQTWMPALEGKKVLVISPFEESIKMQFPKRKNLFNFDYPEFDLQILKCPNTIKGNCPFPHDNWLETFKDMCKKIDKLEFDIAILGCGSYGMPLAHYIKKIGKGSIYTGAFTQVIFGIKGKRWYKKWLDNKYWNEYWKWPEESEIPKSANNVEGGCYWK